MLFRSHKTLQTSLNFTISGDIHLWGVCFAILIYFNILYHKEDYSLFINNLILLNFASLIFLLASQDFIQLLIGCSCFSIIGFYMINQADVKIKFIFYNFFAEIALLTALAIVYSGLGSVSLESLSNYSKLGEHKDLVAVLVLLSVFAKSGMFLFQN